MSDITDTTSKIIELGKFKAFQRKKRWAADDQLRDKLWESLADLWASYAEEVRSRRVPDELCLSDAPSAVFSVLLEHLVGMAEAMKVDDEDILETMLCSAPEMKGRLGQLLHKAVNLLMCGDEDGFEKALLELHARGKITDDELARERITWEDPATRSD